MRTKLIALSILILMIGCKKKEQPKEETPQFEITCTGCTINFSDDNGSISTESNINGSFTKKYKNSVNFQISISVKTSVTLRITHENYTFSKPYDKDVYVMYDKNSKSVNDGSSNSGSSGCGLYNGHSLYLGPQGGCYYLTSGGNKSYIDRSYCKCN